MRVVELIHIRKRFGQVVALDDVSLLLEGGRIHGVLGENGAGKTTAMNVVYGMVRADSGEIRVNGSPVSVRSPRDAIGLGIGMVHQHFMLAGSLSVLDNILLGDRREGQVLDRRGAERRVREISQRLGLAVEPRARVEELSVGEQQRVEILKALYRNVDVLILDEPTAVLTPGETDQLLAAMERLKGEGKAIVFISHKLGEVMRICDDITVLRRGRVVWRGEAGAVSVEELAREMIGRDVEEVRLNKRLEERGEPVLRLEDISARGVEKVSMEVGREIVGVAGVDGNGQQELAEVIVGLRGASSGRILLGGVDVTRLGVAARARLGVAHIPNDRKREGLVGAMSIAQNMALKHHDREPFSRYGVMSWPKTRQLARGLAQTYDIRAPDVGVAVEGLSGGNQQKVVLARELSVVAPRLIVAMNPSRGLDINATNFVYERLLEHRGAGCGIVLISSELDELIRICDRIAVLYRGGLTMTHFPGGDPGQIGQLMAGVV